MTREGVGPVASAWNAARSWMSVQGSSRPSPSASPPAVPATRSSQVVCPPTYSKVPWLPRKLAARSVSAESLENLSTRAGPWLRRIEALSKPRLTFLTRDPLDRLLGLALVLFSASILLPIPLTNTVPGFAVVVIAMGLLQRDGILVILGTLLGTSWIATLLIAGVSLTSLLRAWLGI